jgi:hypothetical protein
MQVSRSFLSIAAFCLLSIEALGQGETTSAIQGQATDSTGAVVAGATVTITSLDTGSRRSGKTDEAGRFNFPQLRPGTYKVEIEAQGFEPQVAENVFSGLGQKQTVSFTLKVAHSNQLTATLEYAFFENDGTFCGCDRDTFTANKTTVYTASGERNSSPSLMTCKGSSGALKSIVFAKHQGNTISIADATQTGFQTHLFGNITTSADGSTFYANTMAQAGMKGVAITFQTLIEVNAIHQACENFLGPLK